MCDGVMEPFRMHVTHPFGLSLSKPGHAPMTAFDKLRLNGTVEDSPHRSAESALALRRASTGSA